MTINCSGYVMIICVPDGDSIPIWIRKAWFGLHLRIIQKTDEDGNGERYIVRQEHALKKLGSNPSSRKAAEWWKSHGFPKKSPYNCFGFKIEHCEPIGNIKYKPTRIRQFVGLLEVGVGAHDHPANQD